MCWRPEPSGLSSACCRYLVSLRLAPVQSCETSDVTRVFMEYIRRKEKGEERCHPKRLTAVYILCGLKGTKNNNSP